MEEIKAKDFIAKFLIMEAQVHTMLSLQARIIAKIENRDISEVTEEVASLIDSFHRLLTEEKK